MIIEHSNIGKGKVVELPQEEQQELYEVLKELPKPPTASGLNEDQTIWWYWFGKEFLKTRSNPEKDIFK